MQFKIIIGIILMLYQIKATSADSRCYLEEGSAENFLASEDLEVGTIIGTLRINGNPDLENGDIILSLRESDAGLKIVPGTKDLELVKELDKESEKGPSSIYVNVICSRRHSLDPSFVIPVNVRVTDVNDNAPQWINAPYSPLILSEVTVPGTRIFLHGSRSDDTSVGGKRITLRAEDADQPGPFSTVEYKVLPGNYSDYVSFLNPLEGTLVLKKALDYESVKNFTVKLRAQDQGTPPKFSDTVLKVIVTDADDQNPKFLRETYTAELPIDGRPGELRMRPEPIKAVDQDEGICAPIQYTIVQSQNTKYFRIHPHSGVISLLTPLGYSDLINGATLVVKATQVDNADRYSLCSVTLTRAGSHSELLTLSFVQKKFVMRIREDTAVGNRILALPTNKPGKHLKYIIPDPINSQFFSVGSLGELILAKPLDYEKMTRHDFQVYATDGTTNATTEVSLEILDVNDWEPRFRQTHYEFVVGKNSVNQLPDSFEGVMIGQVEAADGDLNDVVELSLRGQHAGLFEIDAKGYIYIRPEQLKAVNTSTMHLVATATDSGVPPRSTSVPITVTMEGVAMAQTSWGSDLVSIFTAIVGVFILIILILSCYIILSRKKSRKTSPSPLGDGHTHHRLHNHAHMTSTNLISTTHEKVTTNGNGVGITNGLSVMHMKNNGSNITMANPISNGAGLASLGATTVLSSSADRERQRENYAATVRSIVSRASANGQLYEEDEIEQDSISHQGSSAPDNNNMKKTAWEPLPINSPSTGVAVITNANGNMTNGSNLLATSENTSSENNLTVYF